MNQLFYTRHLYQIFILIVTIFVSCSDPTEEIEIEVDWTNLDLKQNFQDGSIKSNGIDKNKLASGLDEITQLLDIYSIGIVYKGKLITENYFFGDSESLYNVYSVTKSVLSAMYGHIIDKQILKDESIQIGELLSIEGSKKQSIRIDHLLMMTSGISDDMQYMNQQDAVSYILDQDLMFDPGTWWAYTSAGTHILSAILTGLTNESAQDYAEKYLFPELGITNYYWQKDENGINNGGYGLRLRLKDMLKFGHLFLQNGRTANGQILSSDWINKSTTKLVDFREDFGYGYLWWIYISNNQPIYNAVGYGGQYIIIDESKALVIAVTSSARSSAQYRDQLLDVIFGTVISSFSKVN